MAMTEARLNEGKPFTGRTVLYWLGGFFGIMLIANGFFVYFAMTSFPGIEVDRSYARGQRYDAEIAAAAAQNALGWQISLALDRRADGGVILTSNARDRTGAVITGLTLTAQLRTLRGTKFDTLVRFSEGESGRYSGNAGPIPPGRWTLTLDAEQAGERVYRSRSRLFLK